MTLRYPGSAKTTIQNGEEKLMLANKDSSIVAFNFRAGTQANRLSGPSTIFKR